jgi:5'-3' exoribonuclease 1
MGIPSYFSYIIKNHSNIIRSLQYHQSIVCTSFHSLYMDCNSIIYDSFREIEKNPPSENIEKSIIDAVIINIKKYVSFIKPNKVLYIAFDGVAPFAKMEQQRTRRYKMNFMSKINMDKLIYEATQKETIWNTASITPGTNFMNKLSNRIQYEFMNKEQVYGIKNIIVSGSTEVGEGEHKMYEHIRNNPCKENLAIYGLDSDLIMLSIFHLEYCKNIYIFREAPVFGDLADKKSGKDSKLPLFLDIEKLCQSILQEMYCKYTNQNRINDYVFLCFFLGNDFLPHFPALNIRTSGIQILLDTYRNLLGKYENKYLVENKRIVWKNVHALVKDLAKNEHTFLLTEYMQRNKVEMRKWPNENNKDRENMLTNIPTIFRAEEKYICPQEPYWEERYYACLFENNTANQETFTKLVSINYLEGLEWVYKYYTKGCPHWKWKYNYHYPPLLSDLVKYVPQKDDAEFITQNNSKPFSPYAQLCYVLPKEYLNLLPKPMEEHLAKKYSHIYDVSPRLQWAFCKYLWEAHIHNQSIDLATLENIEREIKSL